MSLSTYSNLQTEIGNWLDDSDLDSYIPDFITIAESEIKDRVRIRDMVTRATTTTGTSSRYLELPTGFIEMISLHVDGSPIKSLEQVSSEQINTHALNGSGKPRYFSIIGDELEFDSTPDSTYTVEMKFYKFSALSDSNTTNVILTKYPDLYLNECKKAAALFVKDYEEVTLANMELFGDGNTKEGIYRRIDNAEKKAKFSNQTLRARNRGATP